MLAKCVRQCAWRRVRLMSYLFFMGGTTPSSTLESALILQSGNPSLSCNASVSRPCRFCGSANVWRETLAFKAPDYIVDGRFFALPTVKRGSGGVSNTSLGICLTPKAGSSALMLYLFGTLVRRGVRIGPSWRTCPHSQPALHDLLLPPTKSYMVVRHPSMRIMSAFHEVVVRKLWLRLPQVVPNATFSQAVRAITETHPMAMNPHFRSLLYMCGIVGGRRYETLHFEDWGRLAQAFASHFAPSQPPLPFRESGTLERANRAYTRELAIRVNRWSTPDLTLFHYAPWMPGEEVRWWR